MGHFAGQLIEQAGLKGTSVGAAQVSEKHAGFLINRGGATCDDMLRLIELVQNRVREQFGVELECEVRNRKISSSAARRRYHSRTTGRGKVTCIFDRFRYVGRRQEPRGRHA